MLVGMNKKTGVQVVSPSTARGFANGHRMQFMEASTSEDCELAMQELVEDACNTYIYITIYITRTYIYVCIMYGC